MAIDFDGFKAPNIFKPQTTQAQNRPALRAPGKRVECLVDRIGLKPSFPITNGEPFEVIPDGRVLMCK